MFLPGIVRFIADGRIRQASHRTEHPSAVNPVTISQRPRRIIRVRQPSQHADILQKHTGPFWCSRVVILPERQELLAITGTVFGDEGLARGDLRVLTVTTDATRCRNERYSAGEVVAVV